MDRTESIVTMPVRNPATGRSSRSFRFLGRVDRVTGTTLVDWKSTGDPQRFINTRTVSYQAELYALALLEAGVQVTDIEYRLIKTPTIKYCGKDATRDAYEDRCVEWLFNSDGALVTWDVPLNPARFDQAQAWLWDVAKRVLDCRNRDQWLTNANACYDYSRSCEYLPLCLAEANGGDPERLVAQDYVEKPRHPELDDLNDLDVLTFSSASTMTRCERCYYYKYHRALARAQEETADAPWTGSAMHRGLERLGHGDPLDEALGSIDAWALANPVLGADAFKKQEQQVARARAMVRAALERWGKTEPADAEYTGIEHVADILPRTLAGIKQENEVA